MKKLLTALMLIVSSHGAYGQQAATSGPTLNASVGDSGLQATMCSAAGHHGYDNRVGSKLPASAAVVAKEILIDASRSRCWHNAALSLGWAGQSSDSQWLLKLLQRDSAALVLAGVPEYEIRRLALAVPTAIGILESRFRTRAGEAVLRMCSTDDYWLDFGSLYLPGSRMLASPGEGRDLSKALANICRGALESVADFDQRQGNSEQGRPHDN